MVHSPHAGLWSVELWQAVDQACMLALTSNRQSSVVSAGEGWGRDVRTLRVRHAFPPKQEIFTLTVNEVEFSLSAFTLQHTAPLSPELPFSILPSAWQGFIYVCLCLCVCRFVFVSSGLLVLMMRTTGTS